MKQKVKTIKLTQDDLELISRLGYDKKRNVIGWKREHALEGYIINYPRLCEICGDSLKDKNRYFNHVVSKHGVVGVVL